MERFWGISGRGNIDSALDIHASQHAFNEVREYITRLTWDGVPRLDTLFIDYLGAKDTPYNRAVCRKSFTAAVTRAMIPGYKYDNMVILAGPQGIGKSTLLDKMSRGWFNDSIRTFEGKDASELLQGVWLVEVSELDAFRKTDVARIKQFLSLRADRVWPSRLGAAPAVRVLRLHQYNGLPSGHDRQPAFLARGRRRAAAHQNRVA